MDNLDSGVADDNFNEGSSGTDSRKKYRVEFRGSGGEYFKIWIVNVVLTILTLYIYSAWAKVRTNRYFYGNTFIDNNAFEYHAKPLQILYGRLIAVAALIVVSVVGYLFPIVGAGLYLIIALLIPWVAWRSIKFNARMSSYRNIRFGFSGTAKKSYFILLGAPLLLFLIVGGLIGLGVSLGGAAAGGLSVVAVLLFYGSAPLFHKMLAHYSLNFHRYGTAKFSAPLKARRFYGIYIKTFFVYLLGAIAVIAVIGGLGVAATMTGLIDLDSLSADLENLDPSLTTMQNAVSGAFAILFFLLIFSIALISASYFGSRIRNYCYNLTDIDNRVKLYSTVKTFRLFWLSFSNVLLLIFTLGLGYPWTQVRKARFFAKNTLIISDGTLDQFAAAEKEKISTLGEELGDAFDLDLDVGI